MSILTHLLETITRKLWLELQQRFIEEGFDAELTLVDGAPHLALRALRDHNSFDDFDYEVTIRPHWSQKVAVCLDTKRIANVSNLRNSDDISDVIDVVYEDVATYLKDFVELSHLITGSRMIDLAKMVIAKTPFKIVSAPAAARVEAETVVKKTIDTYKAAGWVHYATDPAYSNVIMIFVK